MKKHLIGLFTMVLVMISACFTLGYCKPSAAPLVGPDDSHSAGPTSDSVGMPPTYKPSQLPAPTTAVTPAAAIVVPPADVQPAAPASILPTDSTSNPGSVVPTNTPAPGFIDNSLKHNGDENE
jgi:hypothetical protein